jgi:UDP-N-acetylmuramate dehydrogenase
VTWLSGFEHIVRRDEPLAPYTWFRLGGAAEYFAEPTSQDELARLVQRCRDEQVSVRLLGGGSNILVVDEGVRGMVIHLSAPAFCDISVEGAIIAAGGGAKLSHVVATAAREGLAGLESLVGIPGTIGGALRGNASGHGASIGQWAREATVMTRGGELLRRQRDEMRFSYRQSSLDELVILGARFQLERQDSAELTRQMQRLWIVKRASEPTGDHGCGYIFGDPRGVAAAELIEQAGLKGMRVGAAEVSERNGNFIVARPGATARDVQQLIEQVRARVAEQLGVELHREIKIWS